tara:strand:- start:165 stop:671 length:507 start_codon:yes stop_codon:yes gene_type:complete
MVAGQWCGFPESWRSVTMPYGDPACIHYKGTQSQRIAELRSRGSGSHQIDEWNQWYKDQATAARVDKVLQERIALVSAQVAIEEEKFEALLRKQLEKQKADNLIQEKQFNELMKLQELEIANQKRIINENLITNNSVIPEIKPEILPSIVATSSLIPLGIIALLLVRK